jgi:hypothetical protein
LYVCSLNVKKIKKEWPVATKPKKERKYRRIPKMLASHENVGGFTKCWRLPEYWQMHKMLADLQNVGVWQKHRQTIESWRALKSPRLVKYQRIWKKLAARLLFGLGGISNC